MASDSIGLNYASAFLDALKTPKDLQRGGDDLTAFCQLLEQVPALTRILDHPGLPLERRLSILDSAMDELKPHAMTRRLLHVVVEKGRVRNLKAIAASFGALRDARLGVASAEVVTAVPLDGTGRAEWEKALSRLSGRMVRVTYRTDAALLGGALTRVGSVVYDGSVRKQLDRLRSNLLREREE